MHMIATLALLTPPSCHLISGIPRRYCGSVPGHYNKASGNLVAGGGRVWWGRGSCLQFIKSATYVKHNKVQQNKTRHACITCLSIRASKVSNGWAFLAVGAGPFLSVSPALFHGSLPVLHPNRPSCFCLGVLGTSRSVTGSHCPLQSPQARA